AHLAFVGYVLANQEVLDYLLGDGGPALRSARLREIPDEGADQRPFIDPLVLVEALVLGCDERLLHVDGNLGKTDPDPPLVWLVDFGERRAFEVEHLADAW